MANETARRLQGRGSTIDEVANAIGISRRRSSSNKQDTHVRGKVTASNGNGTYQVAMNASGTSATCSSLCPLSAGDLVLVLVMRSGQSIVLGKIQ